METSKTINAPPWMVSLFTPLIARLVVNQLIKEHPDWGPREIAAKLRADLGREPNAQEVRLLAEVLKRWPKHPEVPVHGAGSKIETTADWRSPSSLALLAANLVPLYGVIALGWDVSALVLLYWIENVIVGLLNAARMLCVDPGDPVTWAGKLFMVPFFCLHYGMFTAIHGGLVLAFFSDKATSKLAGSGLFPTDAAINAVVEYGLGWSVAAVAASHFLSFLWNYLWRGEFRRASLTTLMGQPYSRVIVLHAVILAGGFSAMALGSPLWALVALLGVKIWLDLKAHRKERGKLGAAAPAAPER